MTRRGASSNPLTSLLRVGPLERPIAFTSSSNILDTIARLTSGWPIVPWSGAAQPPAITVTQVDGGHTIASDWLDEPLGYSDDAETICVVLVQLLIAYGQARPDLLRLHAGAAVLNDRLIVFPASGNIGKSTLIAALAAAGGTIFSDDVLPVSLERGTGSAVGIAPRPRLPLPESFDAATRAFIERHLGVGTDAFAYLALPPGEGPGELAPLGRERSIAAFVLPERTEEIAVDDVALVPATRSDTMFRLIDQHIGTRPPAEAMVVRLAQLIERVPCWKVRYQRADLAARYLVNHPFA